MVRKGTTLKHVSRPLNPSLGTPNNGREGGLGITWEHFWLNILKQTFHLPNIGAEVSISIRFYKYINEVPQIDPNMLLVLVQAFAVQFSGFRVDI